MEKTCTFLFYAEWIRLTNQTPNKIMTPPIKPAGVILSFKRKNETITVTKGSRNRKAPSWATGNTLSESYQKMYANPEQNTPKKTRANHPDIGRFGIVSQPRPVKKRKEEKNHPNAITKSIINAAG